MGDGVGVPGHALRILVVTGEAALEATLSEAVAGRGHRVAEARDGAEASAILGQADAPELALVDATTPDGWAWCLAARAGDRPLHVLALVNRGQPLDGLEEVAADLLFRPFEPAELAARVRVGELVVALRRGEAERQAMLRQVLDTIPQAVFWKDRSGHYLGCNQVFARTVGLDNPDRVLGMTDFDLPWPRHEAEAYRAHDTQVMAGRVPKRHIIEQVQGADGSRIWADTTKLPLLGGQGAVHGVLGVYEDVTERKEREESLARAQRLLEETFEQSPVPMILVSLPDGVLRLVNPACREFLGTEDEPSPVGTLLWEYQASFQDFDPSGHRGRLEDLPLARALTGRKTFAEERRIVRKDGTERWESVYGTPILSTTGEVVAAYLIMIDITDRKRAEAEQARLQALLTQAQKMESVGRLAGGVAHDFNNMLGVIIGHVDLALSEVEPTHPLRDDLEQVLDAAKRSAALVGQLLAFARKQPIVPRVLDLNEAVERTLKLLRRLIGEDITLTFERGQGLWPIQIDPAQVDQMLANLAVNARDAVDGIGLVAIATANAEFDEAWCAAHPGHEPGAFVKLSVTDSGSGMDQETLAHLFEPFFTTKGLGKGTGLGLATVYGVAKQNGGFVTVRSAPGQGTGLAIFLPRHQVADAPAEAADPVAEVQGGTETILLVEDEPSLLRLVQTMLERLGYRVLAAATPSEAIRVTAGHAGPLHLLVTDVVMPEMSGHDLAARLWSAFPRLPCLLISGYANPGPAREAVKATDVQFLGKPFTGRELASAVRQAIGSSPD